MTNQNNSKTQTITMPKEWKGKKIETPEFWKSWKNIKDFCKNILEKDIEKAVRWAKKSSK